MASSTETETQICGNCKKDIPLANFTIHEIHCKRNIDVCTICREPFPKSEMENHIDTEHSQIMCKCNMKMEKRHLETHKDLECPLRPAQCQFCELELLHNKVRDHEDYCGTRTECCNTCGRNVMVKDLQAHPSICGKVTNEQKINSERLLSRYSHRNDGETWFDSQTTRNYLGEDHIRSQLGISRPFPSRLNKNVVHSLERNDRRRVQTMQVDQNLVYEQEYMGRNPITEFTPPGGESAHLDYLLALSIQNDSPSSSSEDPVANRWRNFYGKDRSPSKPLPVPGRGTTDLFSCNLSIPINNSTEAKSNIMLPCEFCEDLIPEEDLILHQSACNPGSVLSSFSKRNSPPVQELEYDRHFRTFLDQTSDPLNNRFASLSDQLPIQGEENIIIPCEFCGIQLEEDIVFQHQDQCDLRPCTAVPTVRSWEPALLLPKKDNLEKETSPQRRIRHQGDVTHIIFNEAENLFDSPPDEFADAAIDQRKPSNIAAAREPLRTRTGNGFSVVRGVPMSNNGKTTSVQARPEFSTKNHQHESSMQDFSEGSPIRPSPSWRNDISPFPMARNNAVSVSRNTKIKIQKPGPEDVQKEE